MLTPEMLGKTVNIVLELARCLEEHANAKQALPEQLSQSSDAGAGSAASPQIDHYPQAPTLSPLHHLENLTREFIKVYMHLSESAQTLIDTC